MTAEKVLKKIDASDLWDDPIVTTIESIYNYSKAEDYHQNYYQNNFLRYLAYKKACQREEVLNKIWN